MHLKKKSKLPGNPVVAVENPPKEDVPDVMLPNCCVVAEKGLAADATGTVAAAVCAVKPTFVKSLAAAAWLPNIDADLSFFKQKKRGEK